WKAPALRTVLTTGAFSGKRSTPYAPGSVHDYMHAKLTVCDDTVFVGSFNLSRSGETNAENVLEIEDAAIADRMAAFIDEVRAADDVAADVVGVVCLEVARPHDVAGEDQPAEPWGEALDLRLDRIGGVAVPAVRHVAVRPRRVLAGRRARVVEETLLHEEDER